MGREEMTEKGSFRVSTSGWQDDSKAQGQGTLVEREGNACVQASFTTSQPPRGMSSASHHNGDLVTNLEYEPKIPKGPVDFKPIWGKLWRLMPKGVFP